MILFNISKVHMIAQKSFLCSSYCWPPSNIWIIYINASLFSFSNKIGK